MKTNICPQCGELLTREAPGGLCPRCVMAMNLGPDTLGNPGTEVPSVAELAPHFPQLEILECLGRGGMGIVYKARQPQLDRLVALKILAPERVDDVRFAERFRREAVSLARLDHPNIVTIYDTGDSGGHYYLLMEFVDGLNLRQAVAGEKMSTKEALAIVPPICAGLQYAHDQGVVHRDIKPENILLDKKGRVKIADFGVAKLMGGPEELAAGRKEFDQANQGLTLGSKLGTPQYMAPEQEAELGEADHRADIYAVGVVFYELLTGERPASDLVAPSKKVEVDVRIDEIVLRALEREPSKRYQSAGEFQTVVETVASAPASPAGSHAMPVQEVPPKKSKTVPIVLGCLALLILVPVFLAVVAWLAFDNTRPVGQSLKASENRGEILLLAHRSEGLSEADFANLRSSKEFSRIDLQDTRLTKADLEVIAKHTEIESLNIGRTLPSKHPQITDDMLVPLKACRNLKSLILHGNPITDEGLRHLRPFSKLEKLQLGGTKVCGPGLAELPQLTWLRLDATPITDEGLRAVGKMRNLEQLYLDLTGIGDEGLQHLHGLDKLRVLNLHGTKVTPEGVNAIKKALPLLENGIGLDADFDKRLMVAGEFGPVAEYRLLNTEGLTNCFLDVETGHVLSAPDELVAKWHKGAHGPQVAMISDWAREQGVDFWLRKGEMDKVILLEGYTIRASSSFDESEAKSVKDYVKAMKEAMDLQVERGFHMSCELGSSDEPKTYIFQTREGTGGVIETVRGQSLNKGVILRVKYLAPE